MKKIFITLCLLSVSLFTMAQSEYISNSRIDSIEGGFIPQKDGYGVMLLSKSNNLVINVTNVPDAEITPKGIGINGLYEYDVIVGPDYPNPNLEVSIRGDVNVTKFVAKTVRKMFVAYLIELVATPIDLQEQTHSGAAVLDATKCEIDFDSNFENLQVEVSPLLGATVNTKPVKGQKDVYLTTVLANVNALKQAKEKVDKLSREFDESQKLMRSDKATAEQADRNEQLEGELEKAMQEYSAMSVIRVSADGTNSLSVSLDGMGPRSKKIYAILTLNKVKKEYVKECQAHMAEAGRLFGLREYANAKKEYQNALNSKDAPKEMMNIISTQMQQCDSCNKYQTLAIRSLTKIRDLRNNGSLTQNDLAMYASAAAEFMRIVYKYNPTSYYQTQAAKLDKMIEDMPMKFTITVVQWLTDGVSSVYEGAPLANIEAWGYYGDAPIRGKEFSNDKRFKKLSQGSTEFRKLGTSGTDGIIQLELVRKELPKVIFFRPNGYDNKIDIERKDMPDLMRESSGDYMNRQFRMKMFIHK